MTSGFPYSVFLLLAGLMFIPPCRAQEKDSVRNYKNIVRLNLSNPALFGIKNNIFGYERMVKKSQSFSINIGRFSMPKFEPFVDDSVELQRNYKDKGFNFAVDYRVYLTKENKYDAPHGLYFGPYYAYNFLQRENKWNLSFSNYTGELISELTLNMHLVGIQLGYQFILWNRVTVDVVFMGPGLWFFDMKTKKSHDLGPEDSESFYEELNNQLKEKFPGYNYVIDGEGVRKSGSFRSGEFGYRYMVSVGYRF
jgi:hypothetical protein